MKSPIEKLLDEMEWAELPGDLPDTSDGSDIPYATHEGTLHIGGCDLRCFRLSDGRAVIEAESLLRFTEGAMD